jgi:hypothetical protein
MRRNLALSLAGAAMAVILFPAASMANPAPALGDMRAAIGHDYSAVQTVQYWRRDRWRWRRGYSRCRAWRRECAARWGWGGRRFRRCVWRHGC